MNSDAWLTGVVGVSGVVLIALVLVALRTLSQARPAPTSSARPGATTPTSAAYAARGMGYLFGAMNSPRRRRSVEDNLQRAFARIDAIDPYGGQRRIGFVLADLGAAADEPDPTPPTPVWPYDRRVEQTRKDQQ